MNKIYIHTVPDAMNDFNRDDFASDAAFLDAVATENVRRNTPEYQAAYKEATNKLREMQREKDMKEAERQYAEAKAKIQLSEFKQNQLRSKAVNRAEVDLQSGKIKAEDFEATANKYYDEYVNKEKGDQVINQRFNDIIRGKR